jgi:hypothetical protein
MRMGLALFGCVFALRRPLIDGLRARGGARRAVVICALALTGCAPAYSNYTDALSDAPVAGSKRQASKKAVPLPSQALLAPQGTPDCEGKGAVAEKPEGGAARVAKREGAEQSASSDVSAAAVVPRPESNADLALRIKLEYERECYRQAEARVREQLRKLQASASETIKAVKQLEQDPR